MHPSDLFNMYNKHLINMYNVSLIKYRMHICIQTLQKTKNRGNINSFYETSIAKH